MKAIELQLFLQNALPDWRYPSDTVDTFKAGDPHTEVRGIAVGWMSYLWALEKARTLGCNVFITHEPTLYDHLDKFIPVEIVDQVERKMQFIKQHQMVVIRCHDLWDVMRTIGIADSWGTFLGFENPIGGDDYVRIYRISPTPAVDVARQVASRTGSLGQPAVQLIGPAEQIVNTIGLGTGAITPFMQMHARFGAELSICTDDGIHYWRDGGLSIDAGWPLLVVNHPVSEEFGVRKLAEFIQSNFPDQKIYHIPQGCMYHLVQSGVKDGSLYTVEVQQ